MATLNHGVVSTVYISCIRNILMVEALLKP